MKATILKGVNIGNNVIIGANSLVNKDIPDNVVAAGNPCRVIMSVEAYYEKRKNAQDREARELVGLYRERYHKEPDEWTLHEFFWLFSDDPDTLCDAHKSMMEIGANGELSNKKLKSNKPNYKGMKAFLEREE